VLTGLLIGAVCCQNEFTLKKMRTITPSQSLDLCQFLNTDMVDYEYIIFSSWVKIRTGNNIIVGIDLLT
jgi:hypothetical protein